ncbi:hypothetical protein ACFXC8_00240 [Streptomyces sp. NPDC059441]|uniref:hypothetical protein n=1 Tax=Streptomyces sp. NPDC059441 TaxID=3346829 RepID=UPI003684AE77
MGARSQGGADSRRSAAGPRRCERCHEPVIKQLVGQRAALNVIADAEPVPLAEALRLMEPNRLAWCVAVLHGGGVELRWRRQTACGHQTVIEHRCSKGTPAGRRPEGTLW